jgi:hypothetical protein
VEEDGLENQDDINEVDAIDVPEEEEEDNIKYIFTYTLEDLYH